MDTLADFFEQHFPEGVQVMTSQFERTRKLEYEWIPGNYHEFITTVRNAPWKILKGMGFGKWDSMNNLIKENNKRPKQKTVSIPIINAPGETLCIEVGRKDCPTDLLEVDEDVILFPGEWYSIIPDGFEVVGLSGESYAFEKGKSDDDIRFGCLPYGIRRPIETAGSVK